MILPPECGIIYNRRISKNAQNRCKILLFRTKLEMKGIFMELYKDLVLLRCFSRDTLIRLTGSKESADWWIRKYLERNYIERIRRDLYAVISLETYQPIANRYQIASYAADGAYVSYHSAFEYYGCANQVFNVIYLTSPKRIRTFDYDGVEYQGTVSKCTSFIEGHDDGVRVTSIERTVIDSIAHLNKAGGVEELLRCLLLVPSISSDKLLEILSIYNCSFLYQKTGYIMEAFQNIFDFPEFFFKECEKKITDSRKYFSKQNEDFVFYKRWKLYAPENLLSLLNKGGSYNAL